MTAIQVFRSVRFLSLVVLIAQLAGPVTRDLRGEPPSNSVIRVLVRGDDMGVAQAANEACIKAYRDGIVRSVEVIVPGHWFLDAVRLLQENPGLDVGVHLCLTSEWERCKWGPLTHSPSLMDADGYFRPTVRQRPDFPRDTGFLDAKPRLDEVERELRAQIETARRHLPRISHLSDHMGAAESTPELHALVVRLAKEYHLRLEDELLRGAPGFSGSRKTPAETEAGLVKVLEELTPGQWLIVEHPGLDTPEMRALGHQGNESVAVDRAGVTRAFTSDAVKAVITARGIQLINYAQVQ